MSRGARASCARSATSSEPANVNTPTAFLRTARLLAIGAILAAPLGAQFRDGFDGPKLAIDPAGAAGWTWVTGEGRAVMDFVQGPGFATIVVDATRDVRNVWWAFIKRDVSAALGLARLREPGVELRIEARIRTDHRPAAGQPPPQHPENEGFP
ncbi:MAG: hypothetical protein MZU79_04410 [Anaerotruncus sp.]|nr:hypothetical protein [Anaerotruncus sp.]